VGMTEREGWGIVYQNSTGRKRRDEKNSLTVCFTGFPEAQKKSLEEIAITHGLIPKSSVVKNLRFLVTGPNPGPAKLARAREMNVPLMTLDQFNHFIETGEIPS
ncbi:MAG: BRCT domain-containing protein, partial [Thiomonas sp.]